MKTNFKTMLKSKKAMMIAAMVLMVALVVGMGSMTYSRYVSSSEMETPATATVAQWGYVVNVNSTNIFGTAYEDGVVNETYTETDSDKFDVKTTASTDVIAPGTSGSMTITISGYAEVLAQLAIDVKDTAKDVVLVYKETAGGAEKTYNPIKWTLTEKVGTAEATNVVTDETLANLATALEAKGKTIEANTNVAETVYTLSWSWVLDDDDNAATTSANDKLDTALGMLANGKDATEIEDATGIIVVTGADKTNTTLTVDISASVVQVQN